MAETGFGAALRWLRVELGYSIRAAGGLAEIDHAYWYRLEEGDKAGPSAEAVAKISKGLKLSKRNRAIVEWLAGHPMTSPDLVRHTLSDPSVALEEFTIAAGIRFRADVRPDAATLIMRARKALIDE